MWSSYTRHGLRQGDRAPVTPVSILRVCFSSAISRDAGTGTATPMGSRTAQGSDDIHSRANCLQVATDQIPTCLGTAYAVPTKWQNSKVPHGLLMPEHGDAGRGGIRAKKMIKNQASGTDFLKYFFPISAAVQQGLEGTVILRSAAYQFQPSTRFLFSRSDCLVILRLGAPSSPFFFYTVRKCGRPIFVGPTQQPKHPADPISVPPSAFSWFVLVPTSRVRARIV